MEPRQPEDPAMAGPYRDPNVMDIDEWPYIMCPSIHEYINTRREVAKKKSEEKRVKVVRQVEEAERDMASLLL